MLLNIINKNTINPRINTVNLQFYFIILKHNRLLIEYRYSFKINKTFS